MTPWPEFKVTPCRDIPIDFRVVDVWPRVVCILIANTLGAQADLRRPIYKDTVAYIGTHWSQDHHTETTFCGREQPNRRVKTGAFLFF
jgi:hypothetical protein